MERHFTFGVSSIPVGTPIHRERPPSSPGVSSDQRDAERPPGFVANDIIFRDRTLTNRPRVHWAANFPLQSAFGVVVICLPERATAGSTQSLPNNGSFFILAFLLPDSGQR